MILPRFFAMTVFPLDTASADGRYVQFPHMADLWEPPRIPLLYNDGPQSELDSDGLPDLLAGHIDSVYRDVDEIRATGALDLDTAPGRQLAQQLSSGSVPVGADLGPFLDSEGMWATGGGFVYHMENGCRVVAHSNLVLRAVTVYGSASGLTPAWECARMWRV